MAKSKSIDKSKLTLGMAKPVIKKESEAQVPAAQIEEAVKQIHNPQGGDSSTSTPVAISTPAAGTSKVSPSPKQEKPQTAAKAKAEASKFIPEEFPAPKEAKKQGRPTSKVSDMDYIRISIDLPKPLYKNIKKKLVDLEITMMDYVTMLIEKEEQGG